MSGTHALQSVLQSELATKLRYTPGHANGGNTAGLAPSPFMSSAAGGNGSLGSPPPPPLTARQQQAVASLMRVQGLVEHCVAKHDEDRVMVRGRGVGE
jgi:hypothetical protein